MISSVAARHPELAFDFVLAHYEQVAGKVEVGTRSRYFPGLGRHSADPAMIGKLQAYASKYLSEDARGDTKTAIASVEYRIKVRNQRLPQIDAWLAQHGA